MQKPDTFSGPESQKMSESEVLMPMPRKIAIAALIAIVTSLVLNTLFEPDICVGETGVSVSIYAGEIRNDPGAYRYLECGWNSSRGWDLVEVGNWGCSYSIDP